MLKIFSFILLSFATVFTTHAIAGEEEAEYFLVNKLDKALSIQFTTCKSKNEEPPVCTDHNVTIPAGETFRGVVQTPYDFSWRLFGVQGTTSDRRAVFGNTCQALLSLFYRRGILSFDPVLNNRIMCLFSR